MKSSALLTVTLIGVLISNACFASSSTIEAPVALTEAHAISLYGNPKYPEHFSHFDWVNPDAPKGGTLRLMGFGTFDSLNPYTLKGTSPFNTPGLFMYGFSELNEPLMAGSGSYSPAADEVQSAYGLIAKTIRYADDFSWVEYDIREQAHFHDGHPIDAEDVVFSFYTLIEKGHPRYQQSLIDVEKAEVISEHRVRFTLKTGASKQAVFRTAELPVLPKHYWHDKDFERASEITPLLSGPYKIAKVDMGSSITLERAPEFWGKDLNIYKGRFNFDRVQFDFYRDQAIAFEAFKSGEFDIFYDYTAKNWAQAYDFPALNEGKVSKRAIPHSIPSGTQGFFFNTRRELFSDRRVRKAIAQLFDFEWTNSSLFHDAYERNLSYFPNSRYASTGLPSEAELALLNPHKNTLPNEVFSTPFNFIKSKGDGNIRSKMREAMKLLKAAGWHLSGEALVHKKTGQVFEFEFIYRQAGLKRVILPFIKNLARLGITATPRLLESAQYKSRLDTFDFDMMTFVLSQGNAPSYEQRDYYHSELVDVEGSFNYAGIQNKTVDMLIDKLLHADSEQTVITVMNALDRVLLNEHYIVPNWHIGMHRVAYWNTLGMPAAPLPYKLGTENWWAQ